MSTIEIQFENQKTVRAKLYDTQTSSALLDQLPFSAAVNKWGDEIYCIPAFSFPLEASATNEPEVGQLGFYPDMPAFCVFYGPTPISSGPKPVAAARVNVFASLVDIDIELLRKVTDGSQMTVTLVKE